MVVEDGWAVPRRGNKDVDVDSSLLGGLAEMEDRNATSKRRGGSAGVIRRRRIMMGILTLIFIIVLVVGSIVGESGSSTRRAAERVCQALIKEETEYNRAGEWVGWASAVKETYLSHKNPAGQLTDNQEEAARMCARSGWQTACTQKLFGSGALGVTDEDEVERIADERKSLEREYKDAMRGVPEPEANELRLPAGIALKIKRGITAAELAVCKMPPVDHECTEARQEEAKVIDALAVQLRTLVMQAVGKKGGKAMHLTAGARPMGSLLKLAALLREQQVRQVVRHRTWRLLDAVSAVVLHESLEGLGSLAGKEREDAMMFQGGGGVQYIGGFKGLRFHGQGVLFYRSGVVAYQGGFQDGLFQNSGVLRDEGGHVLWSGRFHRGEPVAGLW